MNRKWIPTIIAGLVVLPLASYAADITGKVVFDGAAPRAARLRMTADPVCAKAHKDPVVSDEVVVNPNGTLKNVIVYVKDGLAARRSDPPKEKVIFDQIGCIYVPHVLTLQTGQELEIVNSDPTLHNVHSLSKDNPSFNIAQPKQGMRLTRKFEKPEVFKVKCEVHTWMSAYIGVFSHSYHAVTGEDGSFKLAKLPAGEYTIEAWHEKYGIQTAKVKVTATETKAVEFKFTAQ
jgi:plastocyanin